jgi:dolichol-phosphate mannosyltransferase
LLTVIVPAYNEQRTLAATIDQVLALPLSLQLIVVNDGSDDGTAEIIDRYACSGKIIGIHSAQNNGKGMAIRIGLQYAAEPYVVVQDADLECPPDQLLTLVDAVKRKGAHIVYGSREKGRNGQVPPAMQFLFFWLGGKLVTLFANLLFAAHLTDEATCFKLLPTELARRLQLRCVGFEFCAEVTGKLLRFGYPIFEVPVQYVPRTVREGKKLRSRDGMTALLVLLWCRLAPMHFLMAATNKVSAHRLVRRAAAQKPEAPHRIVRLLAEVS